MENQLPSSPLQIDGKHPLMTEMLSNPLMDEQFMRQ